MTKPKKREIAVAFLFFTLAFLFFYNRWIYGTKMLSDNNVKYTIGVIYDIESYPPSGRDFHYYFTIDSITRHSRCDITGELGGKKASYLKNRFINKKFFVKYSVVDTTLSRLLLDKPVIDKTLVSPLMGWDSIPIQNGSVPNADIE